MRQHDKRKVLAVGFSDADGPGDEAGDRQTVAGLVVHDGDFADILRLDERTSIGDDGELVGGTIHDRVTLGLLAARDVKQQARPVL